MRCVIQRVSSASVTVNGEVVSRIGRGFLVLAGLTHSDDEAVLLWMARKIAGLRIFDDETGKMNLGLAEVAGEVLAVSQFTLYADVDKGRRPAFVRAAPPEVAQPLFARFCQLLELEGVTVRQGVFRASMEVSLVNDGPVTIVIDSP